MDLSTTVMRLRLAHPFIAGASPLGRELDTIKQLEDGGCAAIVLPSLFEEQITFATEGRIHHMDPFEERTAKRLEGFPGEDKYAFSPDKYAEHIAQVKRAVRVPVIGSLNGTSSESWLKYATLIEQAGADGLELNAYQIVTNPHASAYAVEHELFRTVSDLKDVLKIPIAVKLSPYFTATANVAQQLERAGANALVLFNRFYQPDIDVDTCRPLLEPELSTSAELPLRLRWLAILHGRVTPSLVATGGIATAIDVVKALLAGAHGVQVVSAILRNGPGYFATLRNGLEEWMARHEIACLDEMRGRLSFEHVADPETFERGNYIRMLHSWRA